jgi:hypothetical protein
MKTRLLAPLTLLLALALPPSAHGAVATFFPGEGIDAGAEIGRVGDLDVARDGSGAVVYVKRDGDADHVFAARLTDGVWSAPERLDAGLAGASSEPAVGAADGGRLAVAFVNGGQLYTVVRPVGAPAWPAAVPGPAPAQSPSVDLSINGAGYVAWAGGGDVRAARLDRTATGFTALAAPLDIDPAATAGDGADRPRVGVAADGVALVAWGEGGHLFARRLFELRPSAAPQRLDVDAFAGLPGGPVAGFDLDVEDDSSFAWVAFRQAVGAGSRVLARRLRGSLFDDPVDVGADPASAPRLDLNGRGEGMVGSTAGATPLAATLALDEFARPIALGDASTVAAQPTPAMAEGGDGVMAWLQSSGGDVAVQARAFDNAKPGPVVTISKPELGTVDAAAGFDAASNRAGDVVVAYVQGTGADRKLVVASYDRAPGAFVGNTSTGWRNAAQPKLSWGASFELWGSPLYTVFVDGKPAGQTRETGLTLPAAVADGVHRWYVVASDRRNQQTRSKTREFRVDATAPVAEVRLDGTLRERQTITFFTGATDPASPVASGLKSTVLDFGDGSPAVAVTGAIKHRFRRGTFTVKVTVTDRAGNVTVAQRSIRIAKAKKPKTKA